MVLQQTFFKMTIITTWRWTSLRIKIKGLLLAKKVYTINQTIESMQ